MKLLLRQRLAQRLRFLQELDVIEIDLHAPGQAAQPYEMRVGGRGLKTTNETLNVLNRQFLEPRSELLQGRSVGLQGVTGHRTAIEVIEVFVDCFSEH